MIAFQEVKIVILRKNRKVILWKADFLFPYYWVEATENIWHCNIGNIWTTKICFLEVVDHLGNLVKFLGLSRK